MGPGLGEGIAVDLEEAAEQRRPLGRAAFHASRLERLFGLRDFASWEPGPPGDVAVSSPAVAASLPRFPTPGSAGERGVSAARTESRRRGTE
jgi:hypothetical protein